MTEIILATSNPNKLKEILDIAKDIPFKLSLVGKGFDPDETGTKFSENAYIKAYEAAKLTRKIALADDSGLCIDALKGEPGIYSARYAPSPKERIEKVLKNLKGEINRKAHFSCAMALVNPKGETLFACEGRIDGEIAEEPKGVNGFGYDPIFFIPELGHTMAEMSLDEKNTLSHRARALKPMLEWIENNLC